MRVEENLLKDLTAYTHYYFIYLTNKGKQEQIPLSELFLVIAWQMIFHNIFDKKFNLLYPVFLCDFLSSHETTVLSEFTHF